MHILLAEDEPLSQVITRNFLERNGHQVTIVQNGQEAVEALDHFRFDVVLMDIQMPVMDGLSAAREVRKRELNKDFRTPILAFTALEEGEDYAKAGMDGYVPKSPFPSSSLLAALKFVKAAKA